MNHHVALEDQADIDSLIRFMSGRALGFVAAGGGSFGSAHVGIYKAFRERGVVFDIFVGTSVGSAMAAGFAKNHEADHLERGTHEIFVRSRSFRRPTWPRYALLDHKAFDRALADQYGAQCRIEDCWRPFAAVATNLSTHNLELIRSGLLWQAVRASSAIPGLLPPFYTPEGAMLVDGCLIDNVPLAQMHQLKSGPNLVVHFGDPADGDVRRRLCRTARAVRTRRGDADAVPQEAAARGAERGQCAVAKPGGASALRYAADRAARSRDAAAGSPTSASPSSSAIPRSLMRPISGLARPSPRWRRKAMRRSRPYLTPARRNGVRRRRLPSPIARPAVASPLLRASAR